MIDKVNKIAYLTYIRLSQVIYRRFIENQIVGLALQGRVLNEKRGKVEECLFVRSILFTSDQKMFSSTFRIVNTGWITRI